MRRARTVLILLATLSAAAATVSLHGAAAEPQAEGTQQTYRRWIADMKASPKGPFERIRWFCNDGTVQPPTPYACSDHGGGRQHGQWNDRAATLRNEGYLIANVLAALEPAEFTGPSPDVGSLAQILIERFLIGADDGWIFRGAYAYRGALQAQDEEAGALALVRAMLADPAWRTPSRFALLRETVRMLPIQTDETTAATVRQLALDIADEDRGFTELRVKIHGTPGPGDAARVRRYAETRGRPGLQAQYERLAAMIDALYAPLGPVDALAKLAERARNNDTARELRDRAMQMAAALTPPERLRVAGYAMLSLRDKLEAGTSVEDGLALLLATLALERVAYTAGNELATSLQGTTRREQITWLGRAAAATYGAGFISKRQLLAAAKTIKELFDATDLTLDGYRADIRYLGRVPEWASATMSFHFTPAMSRLARLEPLANLYVQDRLRGSPLLLCAAIVDNLEKDANRMAGIRHSLFGTAVGTGLRALNAGLARGTLYAPEDQPEAGSVDRDGVYLLPETTSDLPRVAAILTRLEGSSLSHVQLLARNLGIPNVVVGREVMHQVGERVGRRIVVAVSAGGVVQIAEDGAGWDLVFGSEDAPEDVIIRPDLDKLDLKTTELVPLDRLRATDSGRIVGPKGANLGELTQHFGDMVPDGIVVPFGVFREQLEAPIEPGGPSVFEWMKRQYDAIALLAGSPDEQRVRIASFLARLRSWIETSTQGDAWRERLRTALARELGQAGSYGVFVRSDTNVEDLPGFTGAGLNLTVPNVVGFEELVDAVRRVWASPFTERAYGWRQAHMEDPEHVYPAVVIQQAFAADKSGVMVTTDLEGGDERWLSVAVSEGVGGAVEGQAAEQLRINRKTREVRLLAQASAPYKYVLSPSGGVTKERASGAERVLTEAEVGQLVKLADAVDGRFPSLRTADGRTLPADIEFAFRDGRLALLQIRPFVESRRAQQSAFLGQLDAGLAAGAGVPVDLERAPERAGR